jgi:putative restriction endonuclease
MTSSDSLPSLFVAVTDKAWFDFLSSRADHGYLDEANFWSPNSIRPMKRMALGEPVFFRLKAPVNAVAGYGFFTHFAVLDLEVAWQCFAWKNGDPDRDRFLQRIGEYRGVDLLSGRAQRAPIGCTILRSIEFWPQERWIQWGEPEEWAPNIVRGKTEMDSGRATRLVSEMKASDQLIPDLDESPFEPLVDDERLVEPREVALREGQGAFRARLLDAYGRSCAITGEHTEPVLDAAHIQRYLGPRSNHLQNGLLLTKEFHTLFDLGYVTVTPDYVIRVSPSLGSDWHNGKRYYPYDGKRLVALPEKASLRPSPSALAWHSERVFRRAG